MSSSEESSWSSWMDSPCSSDWLSSTGSEFKGKHKIQDRWENQVYEVLESCHSSPLVFRVRKKDGTGKIRALHRNLLLPLRSRILDEDTTPHSPLSPLCPLAIAPSCHPALCPYTLVPSPLTPSHPCTLLPLCPFTLVPLNPLTLVPLFPCALAPTHLFTLVPSHPLSLVLSCPCTLLPSHPCVLPCSHPCTSCLCGFLPLHPPALVSSCP